MLNPVSRRSFLRAVTAGTASVLVGTTVASRADATTATRTSSATSVPDGVVRLGRAYLRAHPDQRNLAALRADLPQLDASAPYRPQLPKLAAANADDFANGRAVAVDGWLLADTEARASAAISLGA